MTSIYPSPHVSSSAYVQRTLTMSLIQQPPLDVEANLFSIPREIRDLIYTALLQIPNDPPTSPEEAGPRFRKGSSLYSVERYPEAVYAALLRCNRQLRDEFQEVLFARQPVRDFRLDCMIKSDDLWPTWILLPCPGTRDIGVLNVDLRLFNVGHGHDQYVQFFDDGRCCPCSFSTKHYPLSRETKFTDQEWKPQSGVLILIFPLRLYKRKTNPSQPPQVVRP